MSTTVDTASRAYQAQPSTQVDATDQTTTTQIDQSKLSELFKTFIQGATSTGDVTAVKGSEKATSSGDKATVSFEDAAARFAKSLERISSTSGKEDAGNQLSESQLKTVKEVLPKLIDEIQAQLESKSGKVDDKKLAQLEQLTNAIQPKGEGMTEGEAFKTLGKYADKLPNIFDIKNAGGLAKDTSLPQELRDALKFIDQNKASAEKLDTAALGGEADGKIGRNDLKAAAKEVGDDPAAYDSKKIDALLKEVSAGLGGADASGKGDEAAQNPQMVQMLLAMFEQFKKTTEEEDEQRSEDKDTK